MKVRITRDSTPLGKKTSGAAAFDLPCKEGFLLPVQVATLVNTGVRIAIQRGFVGMVCSRSGLAVEGIFVLNAPGIIDSDYRGEIGVILYSMQFPKRFLAGERIAQLLFTPCANPRFEVDSDLGATARGEGGFGSTGL
jgi:dUTP pyrophosphatase